MRRAFVFLALLCVACRNESTSSATTSSPAPSSTSPPGQTSVKPLVSVAPIVIALPEALMSATPPASAEPAPSASSKPEPTEAYCVSAAESMEIAKPHQSAAPPYTMCAAGIFSHCGGGDGKRGHLCSKPLDPKATALARKTTPGVCCYRSE